MYSSTTDIQYTQMGEQGGLYAFFAFPCNAGAVSPRPYDRHPKRAIPGNIVRVLEGKEKATILSTGARYPM
jgi:hypothetical protein